MSLQSRSGVASPAPSSMSVQASSVAQWDDDDDLLGGSRASSSRTRSPPMQSQSLLQAIDLDDFGRVGSAPKPNGKAARNGTSGVNTPLSDFDWGEKEDSSSSGDEDVLGDLGKPLTRSIEPSRSAPRPKPVRPLAIRPMRRVFMIQETSRPKPRRSASPPPHIIGQIVEMGFTPSQARQALAKTASGVDVEAALETLLASSLSHSHIEAGDEEFSARRRQREENTRSRVPDREQSRIVATNGKAGRSGASTPDLGVQTDKIMAQATEIGQTMFSKASSFWSAGKERAMKIYEEQRRVADLERQTMKDGKPRWMDERQDGDGDASPEKTNHDAFEDHAEPVERNGKIGRSPHTRAPVDDTKDDSESYRSIKDRTDMLFAEEKRSYHPSRRRKDPIPPRREDPPAPRPVSLPKRRIITATPSQLSSSASHQARGVEDMQLGRYPEAVTAYSAAIDALPEGHLYTLSLLNDRAKAKLNLGESIHAIPDCSKVIDLVGVTYHPSKEAALPNEYARVNLGEELMRGMVGRAQSCELSEKWANALEDWERIMITDPIISKYQNARAQAVEGVRRARSMMANGSKSPQKAVAVPKPSTSRPADVNRSLAVSELRRANQAAELESQKQAAAKDVVDAKLLAWKGGKETNLRALMASLDSALWPEILNGVKIGMQDLIMDKQVKINYMKVIARLHPDKVSRGWSRSAHLASWM